jgi:hypothetical protein
MEIPGTARLEGRETTSVAYFEVPETAKRFYPLVGLFVLGGDVFREGQTHLNGVVHVIVEEKAPPPDRVQVVNAVEEVLNPAEVIRPRNVVNGVNRGKTL